MPDLNIRELEFLRLLMEEQQYRPASYFAEKLNISDKTLYHDIRAIQKYLDQYHVTLQRKTGSGIFLPSKAKGNRELLNDLRHQRSQETALSMASRRKEILKRLLLQTGEATSIKKLSEEFFVSRASIANDIKYIENWVDGYGLVLKRASKGRCLFGEESQIRRAIAMLIRELQSVDSGGEVRREWISEQTVLGNLSSFFPKEEISLSIRMLDYLEKERGRVIGEPHYSYLQNHFLICISRLRKGHTIRETGDTDIFPQKIFEGYAIRLAGMIEEEFDIAIAGTEIAYLYRYLASSGIGAKAVDTETAVDDVETAEDISKAVTEDLTGCVSNALRIHMDGDIPLKEELLQHVQSMLKRVRYESLIQSRILKGMRENYGELLGLCQAAMWCICQKYLIKEVSLNEISYLAAFYQAMLETDRMKKRILVVSDSGFGANQLMVTRLRQNFPQWQIVDVISVRQLELYADHVDFDFLITTVPLEKTLRPYITVPAVLAERDIRNIRDTLSASWMEERFSLSGMKKQYEQGRLLLTTTDYPAEMIVRQQPLRTGVKIAWGHCIQAVIGLGGQAKTHIFREKEESGIWYFVSQALDHDGLLQQLSEIYQILCSPKGMHLMERCYQTQDLKSLFEQEML